LPSLAVLIGGMALVPLTYAYHCFIWLAIKKPRKNGAIWFFNLVIGCLLFIGNAWLYAVYWAL